MKCIFFFLKFSKNTQSPFKQFMDLKVLRWPTSLKHVCSSEIHISEFMEILSRCFSVLAVFGEGESIASYTFILCGIFCLPWHRHFGARNLSFTSHSKDEAVKVKWLARGHKQGGPWWWVSNPQCLDHAAPQSIPMKFIVLSPVIILCNFARFVMEGKHNLLKIT
jgi:hypothetical protein